MVHNLKEEIQTIMAKGKACKCNSGRRCWAKTGPKTLAVNCTRTKQTLKTRWAFVHFQQWLPSPLCSQSRPLQESICNKLKLCNAFLLHAHSGGLKVISFRLFKSARLSFIHLLHFPFSFISSRWAGHLSFLSPSHVG